MGSPNPPAREADPTSGAEPAPTVPQSPAAQWNRKLRERQAVNPRATSGQGAGRGAVPHRTSPEPVRIPDPPEAQPEVQDVQDERHVQDVQDGQHAQDFQQVQDSRHVQEPQDGQALQDAQDQDRDVATAHHTVSDADILTMLATTHHTVPVPENQDAQYAQRHRGDEALVYIVTHFMGGESDLSKGDTEMATDFVNLEGAILAKALLCTGESSPGAAQPPPRFFRLLSANTGNGR